MSIQNKIYKKFEDKEARTELASEKVELGLADDISKIVGEINAGIKDADATLKEFKSAKAEFAKAEAKALKVRNSGEAKSKKALKIVEKVAKLESKTEKMAKDLGISTSAIKNFDTMLSLADDLDSKADDILRFDFDLGQ